MTGREESVAAHLKMAAARKGISFQYATLLYMHEGFLRRLSGSDYSDRFILKGGLLLQCLSESSARTTKDIDLLGRGIANDAATITLAACAIAAAPEIDALRFDQEALADINSRMKDFWDVAYLLENHPISDGELQGALKATFEKRSTPRPADPIVFSSEYARSESALARWKAFLNRTRLPDKEWGKTMDVIRDRLRPLNETLRK
jgi:hypothetical protein